MENTVGNEGPRVSPIVKAYEILDSSIHFVRPVLRDVVVAAWLVGWANRLEPYPEERPIMAPEGEPGTGKTRLLHLSSRVCEDFSSPRLGIDFSAAALYRMAYENGEFPPTFYDEIDFLDGRSRTIVMKVLRGSYSQGGAVYRSTPSGQRQTLRLGGLIWVSFVRDIFDPATRDRMFRIPMERCPKPMSPLILGDFEAATQDLARSLRAWTEDHYEEIVQAYRDVQMPPGFSPRLTGISRPLVAMAPLIERETGREDVRGNLVEAMTAEADQRQMIVRLDDRFWMLPQLLAKAIGKVPVRAEPDVYLVQDLHKSCSDAVEEFGSLKLHRFSGMLRERGYILGLKEARRRRKGAGSLSNALACVRVNVAKIQADAAKGGN